MKILGIDYGRAKIGLAMSYGKLAEPWKVLKVGSLEEAIKKVQQVLQIEQVEKAVVGVSEGEMGEESREFSTSLSTRVKMPVETFDETLSTVDAQRLAIEAGQTRVKRRRLEDAYAATVMLQGYLDSTRI